MIVTFTVCEKHIKYIVRYGLFGIAVFEKNTFLLWKKKVFVYAEGEKDSFVSEYGYSF